MTAPLMPGILSGQGFSFSVDLRRLFRRFRLTGLEITPSKRNDLQTLIPRPAIPFQIVLQLQYAFHIDQRTTVQFSFCKLRGDSAKSNDLIILRSCVSSLTGSLRKIKPKIGPVIGTDFQFNIIRYNTADDGYICHYTPFCLTAKISI